MRKIQKFVNKAGKEPFNEWLKSLDKRSQAKVRAYIDRVALGGSQKNLKPIGQGVLEIKIDYGPGYRVYVGIMENNAMLLLTGGDKSQQSKDIAEAQEYWWSARESTQKLR